MTTACAVKHESDSLSAGRGQHTKLEDDTVDELIQELDDRSTPLIRRRQAEQELIEIGPHALAALERLRSPSGRQSASRIRKAIEANIAKDVGSATLVDAQEGQTLSEALRSLQTQSGNVFRGIDGHDELIDFAVVQGEYWPTFDRMLDIGGLEPSRFSRGANGPGLVERGPNGPPRTESVDYRGAFRIEPLRIESAIDRREPNRSRMTIRCEFAWEPRLQPVEMILPLEKVSAIDDQGREILTSAFVNQLTARLQPGNPRTELSIPFQVPAIDAVEVRELKGELDALLLGPNELFAFSLAESDVPKRMRRSSVEVELERVIRDTDGHQVHLSIRFDEAGDAFASHQDWIFRNPIRLLDAENQSHEMSRFETTAQDDQSVSIVFFFDPAVSLEGATVEYRSPVAIVPHKINFTLKDIRLP